jgi:hypothetical protein
MSSLPWPKDRLQSHKIIIQNNNTHSLQYRLLIHPTTSVQEIFFAFRYPNLENNKRNNKDNEDYRATPKTKKLLHKTFRISEDLLCALEMEAKSKDISLSYLVNIILKDYFKTEVHSEKSGYISTSKDFFRRMFSKVEEKSIQDYGRELGYAIVSEYTYLYFPNINHNTIVQFLETWFRRFQSYHHRFDEENNRHNFSLNHDINLNFSIALKAILQGLIEPVTKSQVLFGELGPGTISFSFEV